MATRRLVKKKKEEKIHLRHWFARAVIFLPNYLKNRNWVLRVAFSPASGPIVVMNFTRKSNEEQCRPRTRAGHKYSARRAVRAREHFNPLPIGRVAMCVIF